MKIEKFTEIIDIVKIKTNKEEMERIYNGCDTEIKETMNKYENNGYSLVDSYHSDGRCGEYYIYVYKKSVTTIEDRG